MDSTLYRSACGRSQEPARGTTSCAGITGRRVARRKRNGSEATFPARCIETTRPSHPSAGFAILPCTTWPCAFGHLFLRSYQKWANPFPECGTDNAKKRGCQMRGFGIVLLVISAILAFVAFNMQTAVYVPGNEFVPGGYVHNFGLMDARRNTLMAAGFIAVVGVVLVAVGASQQRPIQSEGSSTGSAESNGTRSMKTDAAAEFNPAEATRSCPDCAEIIKAQAHVCRFCGRRFADEEVASAVEAARVAAVGAPVPEPTDDQLMERYGITFDGYRYCFQTKEKLGFQTYRYDKLEDAVNYAKIVESRNQDRRS